MKLTYGQLSNIISTLYNCEIEDEDVEDIDSLCDYLEEHRNITIEIKGVD